MYGNIKFMDGIDPTSIKERELATAEKKSHSAKIAHERRRAKRIAQREALLRAHRDSNVLVASSSTVHHVPMRADARRSSGDASSLILQQQALVDRLTPDQDSTDEDDRVSSSSSPTFVSTRTTATSDLSLVPVAVMHRQPHSEACLMFDTTEWMQVFGFWMRVTGPMTARYASPYGEVYTRIIPQLAVTFTPVRHMLLAHAYLHSKFLHVSSADVEILNLRAFHHYNKGMRAMRTGIGGIEFLAAARLGYVFEAMQNNFSAAQMHLNGYRAILNSHEGYRDDNFKQLAASHGIAQIVTSIMTHRVPAKLEDGSRYQGHLTIPWDGVPFKTTGEARDAMALILESLKGITPCSDIKIINDIKTSLSMWSDTLRAWDVTTEPTMRRGALLLLFTLALALLPANNVGKLNYAANPIFMESILKSAEGFFDDRHKLPVGDRTDLMKTLMMLASSTLRLVHLPEYQARSKSLIQRIVAHERDRTHVQLQGQRL